MRWMWIDRIVELQPGKRLVSVKNISLAEEHLHDHFAAEPEREGRPALPALPVMPMSLIIEGMAQTAGILVGHTGGFKEKVILAKIGRAELSRDAGPGMTLRYTATLDRMDNLGAATSGTIELFDHAKPAEGFVLVGNVEMLFSHLDRNMGAAGATGESFPEHNFVFGESFKTLLRCSGIAVE